MEYVNIPPRVMAISTGRPPPSGNAAQQDAEPHGRCRRDANHDDGKRESWRDDRENGIVGMIRDCRAEIPVQQVPNVDHESLPHGLVQAPLLN